MESERKLTIDKVDKKLRGAAEEALAQEILEEIVLGMCKKITPSIFQELQISTLLPLSLSSAILLLYIFMCFVTEFSKNWRKKKRKRLSEQRKHLNWNAKQRKI